MHERPASPSGSPPAAPATADGDGPAGGLRRGDDAGTALRGNHRATRDALLHAADRCIRRQGLAKTFIEDVAAEAGVSRRTVYRYFPTRKDLFSETLERAAMERLVGPVMQEMRRWSEPLDMVVESFALVIELIRDDPVLRVLESPVEFQSLAPSAQWSDYEKSLPGFAPYRERLPHLRDDEVLELADLVCRMVVSSLWLTEHDAAMRDPARLREHARSWFGPRIGQHEARSPHQPTGGTTGASTR